jgi:D-lactate dehydrogenase (cytochrome)
MNALRTRTATRALGFLTRSRVGQYLPRRYTSSSASSSAGGVGYAVAAGIALVSGGLGYYAASTPSASTVGSASTGSAPKPTYGTKEDYQRAIEELRSTFSDEPEAVSTDQGVLQTHGFSIQDPHPGEFIRIQEGTTVLMELGHLHSVVVFVKSTEDVVKVVKIANKYRMPIIPYSGGTSLEGQTRGVGGFLSTVMW